MATAKPLAKAAVSVWLTDETFVSLSIFICIPIVIYFLLKNS